MDRSCGRTRGAPPSPMPVALIADAHLGGPGGPPEPLVEQIDSLDRKTCDRLVLLGDLFHVWVGIRRFETAEVGPVMAALERLRRRGVAVDYIEGNRDFYLEDSHYERFFDSIGTELSFTADGRRYLAVHGDGLNDRDYLYRFWRFLSKNRLSRIGTFLLPKFIASGIIYGTEKELAKTNFKHKDEVPRAVISEYARQRLAEGYDELVLGHFHEPQRWRVGEGAVNVLDAWFNTRRLEWLPGPGG